MWKKQYPIKKRKNSSNKEYSVQHLNLLHVFICHLKNGEVKAKKDPKWSLLVGEFIVRKPHLVNWLMVCMRKKIVLGVRNLSIINKLFWTNGVKGLLWKDNLFRSRWLLFVGNIVVKGAPRLWAAWRHPPTPCLKVGDTPSWRRRLGVMRSTGVPWSPTFSFSFFFFFSSSPASGCKGQRETLIFFFFDFLGPKWHRFRPF